MIFDAIILLLILFFLVRGIWVGFIAQLAFLAALVLGFAAAGAFYGRAAGWLSPWIGQPQLGFFITYALLFLAVYVVIMLMGKGLRKVMTVTMLGWFDRLLGGLFGLLKGVFLATLLFILVAGLFSESRPMLRKTFSYRFLVASSEAIVIFIHDANLRERFIPREPAIPESMTSLMPAGKLIRGPVKQIAKEHRLVN